jgi:hypothetical protein
MTTQPFLKTCIICSKSIGTTQKDLLNNVTGLPLCCEYCMGVDDVFVYDNTNKYIIIKIDEYNEIKDNLRRKIGRYDRIILPNVTSSRLIYIKHYKQMEQLVEEYKDLFLDDEGKDHITDIESEMEDIEEEIERLQEELGDYEREIKEYPLKTLKRKLVEKT